MSVPARPPRELRCAPARLIAALVVVTAAGSVAQVQVLRPRPPQLKVGGAFTALGENQRRDENTGPAVRMPVSLNIDRHLRKAQGFLQREDWSSAFKVLHDVIEGRTLTDDEATEQPADTELTELWDLASARQAVFSNDDRIYRPVKSLCHELLASLPNTGMSAYRTQFEFDAERALEQAMAACDVAGLEAIVDSYFVTLSAARALEFAGDLRMDRGQFRAALQNYRMLLEVYPEEGRTAAAIDEAYVRCKIALCFSMLGANAEATEALDDLALLEPDATLRIEGELVATDSLAELSMFSRTTVRAPATSTPSASSLVLDSEFVPLWEFRFAEPRPYRVVRDDSQRSRFTPMEGASAISVSPTLDAPGTSASIVGDRILFLDHFRLRSHEALSGRMLLETDEPLEEKLRPDRARARVPVYDFATARVRVHRDRIFTVLGPRQPRNMQSLLDNRLIAYDRETLLPIWNSGVHAALGDITFLAAPTIAGDKLLLPIQERGTFGLQALDANTGAPIYRVAIHRGGTMLARHPASPVAIDQGTAYALSNSGALAAVDVHTGALLWIRRYERLHPTRPLKLRIQSRSENPFGFQTFTELSQMPGFAPSDIVTADGTVLIAPCDGNVLACLDGATGEPLWMLNRSQRVPTGSHFERWQYVIGHDDRHLVVGSDLGVTCIDLRTGIRRWRQELPTVPGQGGWRGRGVVTGGHVIVPGVREVFVRPLESEETLLSWRRVALPELSIGRDPLEGPFNLGISGVFLTACYEGGIEVYSTVDSLLRLAEATEAPARRSLLQAQAGDLFSAFETLERVDPETIESGERRDQHATQLLTISSELAIAMAAHGARQDAIGILDRCRARLTRPRNLKLWHLARIEVFQALGDLDGVDAEQRALYALMEGR